jgi:hypothetical protein
MSKARSSGSSGDVGVLGLLGVLFVGLKLVGVVDWSWWLVTLPFWGGLAVAGVVLLGLGAFYIGKVAWKRLGLTTTRKLP